MDVALRDYQKKGISDIENAWKNCDSVLFQMPTGTGKTTLFCEIAQHFTQELFPEKKVLIITHTKELIQQVFTRINDDFGLKAGRISASFIEDLSAPIQVASIQTLVRRVAHQQDIFSLVIIDEAHHALASTYRKLWEFFPSSKFLGVTATPIRTNGEGFQDLFQQLITTNSVKWFIEENWLSDVKYYASHAPDISNIKIKAGDYDETELAEVMQDNRVMADLVQSYKDFTLGKKMIVFAVNRSHCAKIVEKFRDSGFPAELIDSMTPKDERQEIVEKFRSNKFTVLCNVNIFTEGFDCPDVEVVQLARPTKSLTLFLQQVGRCMRPHKNKSFGIVLDNAGLWKEYGLPKMERYWSLDGSIKIICPTQKDIKGIKQTISRENNEPHESKSIELVEVGELEDKIIDNPIDYSTIEKSLTDNKIRKMREEREKKIEQIKKLQQRRANETDPYLQQIDDKNIIVLQKELYDLQAKDQPERFEQVFDLILEKCQNVIDNNDIFLDGDKDVFLKCYFKPELKLNQINLSKKSSPDKNNFPSTVSENLNNHKNEESYKKNENKENTPHTKLKVTFPDSEIIDDNNAKKTLIEALKKLDIEKVFALHTKIVSDKANNGVQKVFTKIPGTNYYINDGNNTDAKKKFLENVAQKLGVDIKVEVVEKK